MPPNPDMRGPWNSNSREMSPYEQNNERQDNSNQENENFNNVMDTTENFVKPAEIEEKAPVKPEEPAKVLDVQSLFQNLVSSGVIPGLEVKPDPVEPEKPKEPEAVAVPIKEAEKPVESVPVKPETKKINWDASMKKPKKIEPIKLVSHDPSIKT